MSKPPTVTHLLTSCALYRILISQNLDVYIRAEARINTWIAATGSFFQSYLRRALSNLASDEAERRQAPTAVYDDPPTPLARVNSGTRVFCLSPRRPSKRAG